MPLAESVVKLTAVCMECFREAAYTKRLGAEKEVAATCLLAGGGGVAGGGVARRRPAPPPPIQPMALCIPAARSR